MSAATLQRVQSRTQAQALLLRTKLSPVLAAYVRHRPLVQQALTAGFVVYCVASTYLTLTGRGKAAGRESSARRSRGKDELDDSSDRPLAGL